MKIKAFDNIIEFKNNESLLNILKEFTGNEYTNYYCAIVNNELVSLNQIITSDCEVEFLDLSNREAVFVYQATLRYICSYALREMYPNTRIIYNYSISRSIFCQPVGLNNILDPKLVKDLEAKMKEIVNKDLPINCSKISTKKAVELYEKEGFISKCNLLRDMDGTIDNYELNGYNNYLYTPLCPSTGFIKKFKLHLYSSGIIIQYPRYETNGEIPEFINEQVLGKYLRDANKWGAITSASYIANLNKIIDNNEYKELINLCETRHNNMLAELGENIQKDIENIKLICVAGPSSSGKTTFTNRLRIELLSRGIKPLMISLDNYYKGGDYPLDQDGKPDYEHVEALNLELFSEQMISLISGHEVRLPIFNFQNKETTFTEPVKLGKNQPIMIEGIHALNKRLTGDIPADNQYKIYIAPQAQLHIDSQSPISMTDIRLIRRLVRDYRERNSNPEHTISMWPSVRRGEFKWIYPFQENANYVFNSELTYELAVLKKPALEVLKKVKKDSKEYVYASKLINILNLIKDMDSKWVPCNSILKEFLGGSIFYDD